MCFLILAQALNQHYNSDNDVVTIINYLFSALDSTDFEKFIYTLEAQTEKHKETIMNIAQRLHNKGHQEGLLEGLQKGKQEGLQKGLQEGVQKTKTTLARNLLINGVSPEIIMKSTGLSRDELTSLK